MKDFGSFLKRNQTPFDFNEFSKTLQCPKTTNLKKLKIVASKVKEFDVFWGEIRPTLDFTHFSKIVKCPKTTRFQGRKLVDGKLKIIFIGNEGFSTFSEAKKHPPLSGYEICSKFNCDLPLPDIRRKKLMSQKRAAKPLIFENVSQNHDFRPEILIGIFYSRKCATKLWN